MGIGDVGVIIGMDSLGVLFRMGVPSRAKAKQNKVKKLLVMLRAPPEIHRNFAHIVASCFMFNSICSLDACVESPE